MTHFSVFATDEECGDMRVQRRSSVVLMGCLTVTAVAMAGRPAIAVAEPAPTPGSGNVAIDPGSLDPRLAGELRDALAQLHPLDPGETASMRDRAVRDVRAGVVPWRSAEMPAWDRAAAFGLPDGRTLVAAPPATATGDSLGVLYDADGTVSHHTETHPVTHPDESATVTVWTDDAAPVERAFTADQLHSAAASVKEVTLESCVGGLGFFALLDLFAVLVFLGMFTPALFIEILAAPLVLALYAAALVSPLGAAFICIFGWF
ncbi:hypothetical protein [Nocardia sp. NPDC051570]|uniref:hypothetical protein n=1 Tax=Nocardia sp. NPDC051570 TaxID=3364324 RepID=UPI00379C888F